jgi:hypothetical protein
MHTYTIQTLSLSQKIVLFLLALSVMQAGHAQSLLFDMPLKGIQGRDFFIDNYVDHDSTSGILDPFCGTKTYDGHKGSDMILRSFKTMDSGVYVYAAADGIVIKKHDGEYDRNKKWVKGRPANFIGILHHDGFTSYYLHLMKNSLMVKLGDNVKAGQPIGKVGSSGFSSTPHLHFEVRDSDDHVVDPFEGNCQAQNKSMWRVQPGYDTALYVIDQGFTPYHYSWDTLKERYMVKDTFYLGEQDTVAFWVHMHGKYRGSIALAEWYSPFGELYRKYDFVLKENGWHDYIWPYIKMPATKGEWMVRLLIDNKLVATVHFHVLRRKNGIR